MARAKAQARACTTSSISFLGSTFCKESLASTRPSTGDMPDFGKAPDSQSLLTKLSMSFGFYQGASPRFFSSILRMQPAFHASHAAKKYLDSCTGQVLHAVHFAHLTTAGIARGLPRSEAAKRFGWKLEICRPYPRIAVAAWSWLVQASLEATDLQDIAMVALFVRRSLEVGSASGLQRLTVIRSADQPWCLSTGMTTSPRPTLGKACRI